MGKRLALGVTAMTLLMATAAHADEPSATIEGVEDRALREAIQRVIAQAKGPPLSRTEARRRAREAGDDAVAVLRSEGYYAYVVDPDVSETDPPRALVRITPGPLFVFADPAVAWTGQPPDEGVRERAWAAAGLKAGAPGRAADVLGAEGRAVAQVQKLGYADAAADPREVVVDHADHTVRPTLHIAAGDLTKLDGVQVVTKGRTNPAWVRHLAPWRAGDVYGPDDIGELERRLRDTGVYDSISVALAPKDKVVADGLRPVVVTLSDRPARTLELGAGYSTSEGSGVDLRWIRYNQLNRADTTTLTARLAQLDSRLEAALSLPHWGRPQQTLKLDTALFRDTTSAYDETGAQVSADLTRRLKPTIYRTYGVSFELTQTIERIAAEGRAIGQTLNLATLTGLAAYAWDRSDDVLNPRRGWRLEARVEPTAITGDTTLAYLRTQAQGSFYLPLDRDMDTVAAVRLKLGDMLGGRMPDVPAARRFFAGGGGSVRGYAYQAIGPRLPDNTPQGGLSLFEASLEMRHKFTQRWGAVAFVDTGAIGTDALPKAEDFRAGIGLGVRYDLGFGPIRADFAVPLGKRQGDPAFQVYLSIGQSF